MTALPLRPALVDALCAISVCDPEMSEDELRRLVVAFIGPHWPFCAVSHRWESGPLSCDWITRDPAEAFETLISRGVLPDSWAGDERRAFVRACARCDGSGSVADWSIGASHAPCDHCGGGGKEWSQLPATIPALVSWASLGPAAILRAEELARETVLRLRPWGAPQTERVVWRVGGRQPLMTAWSSASALCQMTRAGLLGNGDEIAPAASLWRDGLALDSITADAVTIVVPPVGAS